MRRRLARYVLSSWAAWVPSVYALSLVALFATIHAIAWSTGHTTITNSNGEKIRFAIPPISLTGNHPPEYFMYAFGCVAAAFAAMRHVAKLRKTLKEHINYVVETMSQGSSSAQLSSQPSPLSPPPRHHHTHHPSRQPSRSLRHSRPVSHHDRTATPSHRAAFWRSHFHAAPRPDETATEFDSGQSERDVWKHNALHSGGLVRRPLLLLAVILLHIGLIAFSVQAAFPAQTNTLHHIGKYCQRIQAVSQGPLLLPADSPATPAGHDIGPSELKSRVPLPALPLPDEESEDEELDSDQQRPDDSSLEKTENDVADLPPSDDAGQGEDGGDGQDYAGDGLEDEGDGLGDEGDGLEDEGDSPEGEGDGLEGEGDGFDAGAGAARRYLQQSISYVANNLVKKVRALDPSRPKYTEPSEEEEAEVRGLIYCRKLGMLHLDTITLVHALGAVTFFFLTYAAMACFNLWLIHRRVRHRKHLKGICILRPTWTSIIIKSVLTILPWLKPLELVKSDILRHVSLVDWSGIAQRFAVLCILLYVCSLGLEVRALKRGVESISDALPR